MWSEELLVRVERERRERDGGKTKRREGVGRRVEKKGKKKG